MVQGMLLCSLTLNQTHSLLQILGLKIHPLILSDFVMSIIQMLTVLSGVQVLKIDLNVGQTATKFATKCCIVWYSGHVSHPKY